MNQCSPTASPLPFAAPELPSWSLFGKQMLGWIDPIHLSLLRFGAQPEDNHRCAFLLSVVCGIVILTHFQILDVKIFLQGQEINPPTHIFSLSYIQRGLLIHFKIVFVIQRVPFSAASALCSNWLC